MLLMPKLTPKFTPALTLVKRNNLSLTFIADS